MIKAIKRRFAAGSFSRHAATLMSGTLVAQLIGFASLPFLTRLYTVADFGEYALYFAVAGFGTVIATGRYEMAIMLPKRDRDAINLVALSVLIAVSLSSFVLVLISIVGLFCNQHGICESFPIWVYLIPATILLSGIYQAINYWLSRNKQFYILSQARVAQAIVTAVVGLTLGYVGMSGGMGLIYGGVAGQFVCTLMLVWAVKWKLGFDVKFISSKRMQLNALRYKDFPAINSLHVATDTLQSSGVPLLIGSLFGATVLGSYALAIRAIKTPLGLVSGAVSQVFFQRASAEFAINRNIRPLYRKTIKVLIVLGVVLGIFIAFLPPIFPLLFGKGWDHAGRLIYFLMPWVLMTFVISPVTQIPIITNYQRKMFAITLVGNLTIILSIGIGALSGGLEIGLIYLSVSLLGYFVALGFWLDKISGGDGLRKVKL